MSTSFSAINQLAQSTGVSSAMIRHYEKLGLLDERHVERLQNGYRTYTDAAVSRISLIQLGQFAGFSLAELHQGLDDWENDTIPQDEKVAILKTQLHAVSGKIERLAQSRDYILSKLENLNTK